MFPMSFNAAVRYVGDIAIVEVAGRLALGEGAGVLRETIRGLVSKGDKKILVKLKDVTFIDSSGLGELVGSYATAANAGGTIKLLNVESKVQSVMMIAKLSTVFESFNTESIALLSFS
jgi:anti-sigma B factor antagonist